MIDDDDNDDDDRLPSLAFGSLHLRGVWIRPLPENDQEYCDLANIIIDHDDHDHDTNIVHYDLGGDDDDGDLELSLILMGTHTSKKLEILEIKLRQFFWIFRQIFGWWPGTP